MRSAWVSPAVAVTLPRGTGMTEKGDVQSRKPSTAPQWDRQTYAVVAPIVCCHLPRLPAEEDLDGNADRRLKGGARPKPT